MTDDAISPSDCTRAAARRNQILDAAEACFREYGFHGASISKISKSCGMSAGHIYHYFENKEAIIAAIVAGDLDRLLNMAAQMRAADDILEAMLERVGQGVIDNLDPSVAGLELEIAAEASRNEDVANVVRRADKECATSLMHTLRLARQAAGKPVDDAEISAMAEVIVTMFEGLLLRSIRNPEVDRQAVVAVFQKVIRSLVTS
ncbi:MAG: TetR/AcrR family transcriptional regulator [Rhodocyclaceae bacterium]|nr:TetR/AcrR family transcriptional regulator [Rhodocyclaceae bacterium]MCP5233797.1 TetR/AcrR family transcriptional regulator [Zoogloeaceae bacterium]MCP5240300.1 TetR/AcrR family transcriptional regulator [Zoogloeaceae bacterium]MCP5253591.1 TetR/AcrR family transcriptional regulator [Zoogloeaceae bacterium]MCP5295060.1 TetR/AcrR family transcriptional regulator [Zoogloeaceae bacterium]